MKKSNTKKNKNYLRVLSEKYEVLRQGLKMVHIGQDVWLIGKISNKNGKKHQVIYGPDKKEYHLYDADVDFVNKLNKPYYDDYGNYRTVSNVNRHGNTAIECKVKIYILSHILDNRNKWCFDLSIVPEVNNLKIIYNNGTVKNVNFNGVFEQITIAKDLFPEDTKKIYSSRTIKPVGYRKCS